MTTAWPGRHTLTYLMRATTPGEFDNDCQVTDFDARQVASVYGLTAANRNFVDDAKIDLRDVIAVAKRTGANCVTDRSEPVQNGSGVANFVSAFPNRTITIGERIDAPITLASLAAASAGQVT